MTAVEQLPQSSEGVRSRTITWTDPARARFRGRNLTGYDRLVAIQRGQLAPPPAAALLGMQLDEVECGTHRVQHVGRRDSREPDGNDARRDRRDPRRHRDGLRALVDASRRRRLHDARAQDQLRTRDHAGNRRACTRRARSCTPAAGSQRPKRECTTKAARCTRHATSTCLITRAGIEY